MAAVPANRPASEPAVTDISDARRSALLHMYGVQSEWMRHIDTLQCNAVVFLSGTTAAILAYAVDHQNIAITFIASALWVTTAVITIGCTWTKLWVSHCVRKLEKDLDLDEYTPWTQIAHRKYWLEIFTRGDRPRLRHLLCDPWMLVIGGLTVVYASVLAIFLIQGHVL